MSRRLQPESQPKQSDEALSTWTDDADFCNDQVSMEELFQFDHENVNDDAEFIKNQMFETDTIIRTNNNSLADPSIEENFQCDEALHFSLDLLHDKDTKPSQRQTFQLVDLDDDEAVFSSTGFNSGNHGSCSKTQEDSVDSDSSSASDDSAESDTSTDESTNQRLRSRSNDNERLKSKDIYVVPTHNFGQRRYDKKDNCLFCQKLITNTNFCKHILRRHQSEEDVRKVVSLPPLSIARKTAVSKLRNLGNFMYNKTILQNGGGLLVVHRPSKVDRHVDRYAACSSCYGFYKKSDLRRHKCVAGKTDCYTDRINLSCLRFSKDDEHDAILFDFFIRMQNDVHSKLAMNDETICNFICHEIDEKGMVRYHTIVNKVRLLCELVSVCRKERKDDTMNLSDILLPETVHELSTIIKNLFNYKADQKTKGVTVDRPSSLVRLHQTINQISIVLQVQALNRNDFEGATKLQNLPTLIAYHIGPLAKNASRIMRSSTSGEPQQLPTADALIKVNNYLKNVISSTERTSNNHRLIAECVLAKLLIYNKRRSSEVAKIRIEDWNGRGKWKDMALKDIKNLDETEKIMVKDNDIIYVLGKCRKFVPVIFPSELQPAVKWLAEKSHNIYLFPNKSQGYIRGHDALRHVCLSAGVAEGDAITSTKSRKLLATILQVSERNIQSSDYKFY